jgi:hypothetical protein
MQIIRLFKLCLYHSPIVQASASALQGLDIFIERGSLFGLVKDLLLGYRLLHGGLLFRRRFQDNILLALGGLGWGPPRHSWACWSK